MSTQELNSLQLRKVYYSISEPSGANLWNITFGFSNKIQCPPVGTYFCEAKKQISIKPGVVLSAIEFGLHQFGDGISCVSLKLLNQSEKIGQGKTKESVDETKVVSMNPNERVVSAKVDVNDYILINVQFMIYECEN